MIVGQNAQLSASKMPLKPAAAEAAIDASPTAMPAMNGMERQEEAYRVARYYENAYCAWNSLRVIMNECLAISTWVSLEPL